MKRGLLLIAACVMAYTTCAQSPDKMSYQAVVRDASDALVVNTSVGMKVSILQGSSSGNAVYIETQIPTANSNGLVSVEIGGGTIVNGDFSTIDWANGPYFVKTETDPTGGTNYTITGTSQLLSVPYALHASVADSIAGGSNSLGTPNLVFEGTFSIATDTIIVAHNSDPSTFIAHSFIFQEANGIYNMDEEIEQDFGGGVTVGYNFKYWADLTYIYITGGVALADLDGQPYKITLFLED